MSQQGSHPHLDLEYTQINNNIRFLAEVRFKLLALLPTLGGVAVFALAHLGLKADNAAALPSTELPIVFVVSLFGFFATLGITLYDQRNSELYNALMHRAKFLEKQFDVRCSPGGLKQPLSGGQFSERPRKGRRFFFEAGHDFALALIYGPLLGAWFFPTLLAALRYAGAPTECAQAVSTSTALLAALAFTLWLIALDRQELQLYRTAAKRDGLRE